MVYCIKLLLMKKLLRIAFLVSIFVSTIKAQNIYDPYIDYNISSTLPPSYLLPVVSGSGFIGEYQWFIREEFASGSYFHHWSKIAKADPADPEPYSLSYKIETVSFPFAPQVSSSGITNRVLHAYSNTDYNSTTDLWNGRVEREYIGNYASITGALYFSKSINGPSSIVSTEFHHAGGVPTSGARTLYPHSILKHTLYLYCNSSLSGKPIDSLQFVVDLTRGRMRNYPFYDQNYTGLTAPTRYDVLLTSTLNMPNEFGATTNENEQWNPYFNFSPPPPLMSTINYFPYPYGTSSCKLPGVKYYPTEEDFPPFSAIPNPIDFVHPPPYSLSGFELLNSQGNEVVGYNYSTSPSAQVQYGLKHEYVIDQPIDLTIINPTHKVIYNPSETNIDLNNILVFPSGYVFKTVDGIYPDATQVYNADPDRLYNDPREIPTPTTLSYNDPSTIIDERKSYYYIKNGSTLKIESCVGIYDADIVVENGGTLIYDHFQTYGNFNIVQQAGGIVIDAPLVGGGCAHDCYDINNYDVKNILISSDETWTSSSPYDLVADGVLKIAGTLRIQANKTLTIGAGFNIEFGENAEIIVDKGGKLIINGTSSNYTNITSAGICKKGMWYGIQVKGDLLLPQTGTNQGVVQLNFVKISNARVGIASSDGGIIKCQNVEFKNNRTSASFITYHNKPTLTATVEYNNVSYFKNCQFLTTARLNDPIYQKADGRPFTLAQISMWDVKNVAIESCLFENSATKSDGSPLYDTDLRGTGIYALDAGVQLREFFPNEFRGLSDAVWALNIADNDLVWIQGTTFKNNVHGVTLEATKNSIINLNNFEIPEHKENLSISDVSLGKGYNKPVGLYLIKATDFTAQENVFTNFGTATTSSIPVEEFNYGMIVNNCSGYDYSPTSSMTPGTGLGYAYKNTFSNLNVSQQNELDNKGGFLTGTTPGGLEFKCQNYNGRINNDIIVAGKNSSLPGLIRDQGACGSPDEQSGNLYTTSCVPSLMQNEEIKLDNYSDIYPFIYRDNTSTIPACANTILIPCTGISQVNSCPSNFSLCATIPCLTAEYSDALFAAKQILAIYKQLLDGGDTSFLLDAINGSMAAGSLKNLLISKSPYLSDEVLIATLNRNDLPPYGHLEQIFIANSPVTSPVISALENTGLPSGILNNIMSAQTGISARSEKESEVDYYAFQARLAEVNLKQGYLKIDNTDSLEILGRNDSTLAGLFKLIRILIDKGSYSDAQTCLNKIKTKEGGVHSDECKLFSIKLNLALNNKTWFDMSANQSNIIKQIYQSNPETAIEARAILALTKGLEYERYPFDVQTARAMSGLNQEPIEAANTQSSFKVYPNPSSDFTKVEISFEDETVIAEFIIYNILGEEVSKQRVSDNDLITIITKDFNNGIYLFVLKSNKGIIEKQKIIVSK